MRDVLNFAAAILSLSIALVSGFGIVLTKGAGDPQFTRVFWIIFLSAGLLVLYFSKKGGEEG